MPDNPLGIVMLCPECVGLFPCGVQGHNAEAFIPLAEIPENVIEDLRKQHLKLNTVDSTAEEMGEPPPGIKDPEEQLEQEALDALNNPIDDRTGEGQSPGAALG